MGIKWKIRNILKDGTVLEPNERLPVTDKSLDAFKEYGKIALKATLEEPTEFLCAHYIAEIRKQVAVKTARMRAYSW